MNIINSNIGCCTSLYQLPLTQLLLGDSFHPGGLTLTKTLAQKTLINRQSIVLDVAAGKGSSASYLTKQYGAQLLALDLGIDNLKSISRLPKVQPIVGSAQSLPFIDNSVDVILCECALCLFTDKTQSLKEMHRVLKPGGFIAISDIYLNKPLPELLNNNISQWLCIADALSSEGSQNIIAKANFTNIRFSDESSYLINTIKEIEKKINRLKHLTIIKSQLEKFNDFPFKKLAEFIVEGNSGYYLLTARKLIT
ncbi:MAG: methyltransferase domain-containing protein [Colwellia sp.]